MGWLSDLFSFGQHPDKDGQTEIELAISHNEARGDAGAIPDAWYEAVAAGIETFDELPTLEDQEGGWI